MDELTAFRRTGKIVPHDMGIWEIETGISVQMDCTFNPFQMDCTLFGFWSLIQH